MESEQQRGSKRQAHKREQKVWLWGLGCLSCAVAEQLRMVSCLSAGRKEEGRKIGKRGKKMEGGRKRPESSERLEEVCKEVKGNNHDAATRAQHHKPRAKAFVQSRDALCGEHAVEGGGDVGVHARLARRLVLHATLDDIKGRRKAHAHHPANET